MAGFFPLIAAVFGKGAAGYATLLVFSLATITGSMYVLSTQQANEVILATSRFGNSTLAIENQADFRPENQVRTVIVNFEGGVATGLREAVTNLAGAIRAVSSNIIAEALREDAARAAAQAARPSAFGLSADSQVAAQAPALAAGAIGAVTPPPPPVPTAPILPTAPPVVPTTPPAPTAVPPTIAPPPLVAQPAQAPAQPTQAPATPVPPTPTPPPPAPTATPAPPQQPSQEQPTSAPSQPTAIPAAEPTTVPAQATTPPLVATVVSLPTAVATAVATLFPTPIPVATLVPIVFDLTASSGLQLFFSLSGNMAGGAPISRDVVLQNNGAFTIVYYLGTTLSLPGGVGPTPTPLPATALWTDATFGLQAKITLTTGSGTPQQQTFNTYDGPINFSGLLVGNLAVGVTHVMNVTIYLPESVPNAYQATQQTTSFVFTLVE